MRDHLGADASALGEPQTLPGGAALVADGVAWVLAEDGPERALGPAMAWGRQAGTDAVHVLAESATGLLARRAAYFRHPPRVWRVEGRDLVEAEPEGFPVPAPIDPAVAGLREVIEAGGADAVEEHGVLAGEVFGLEVCRAVVDPFTGAIRLEVGVGAHDREAFQLIHGDVPPVEALADVAAKVRRHRAPGGEPHPLQRLGAERLLRAELAADPGRVRLVSLAPAAPPVPRPNLRDPVPCVALGVDAHGRPAVVVCSVGIDLDLVPYAADARSALAVDGARLLLAVPERDAHPVTRALVERLVEPGELIGV